ncbi:MAG: 7TM diverse intracellular signaling domain-containing protein, partial [Leptospirales bacterium]
SASAFGFSDALYWLRFRVANPGREDVSVLIVIDNEYLDRLDLYGFVGSAARADGVDSNEDAVPWEGAGPISFQKTAGREFHFYSREVPHRKYAFPVRIEAGSEYSIYISARSRNPLSVPVSIMSEARYADYWSMEQLRMGIYAGFFALLLAANLVLYFHFQDRIFLIYVAYLGLNFLYQFSLQGYSFQYIWPMEPDAATGFTTLISCLTAVAALVFSRQFLGTRRRLPRADRVILCCIGLALLLLASLLFFPAYLIDRVNSVLLIPACIVVSQYAGIRALLQGYRPARFYVVAWGGYSLLLIVFILQIYAVLPNYLLGVEMLEGLAIGTSIEMLFFPFAIADRIRLRLAGDSRSARASTSRTAKEVDRSGRAVSRIARLDQERVGEALHEAMEVRAIYREKITLRSLAACLDLSEKDLSEFLNEVLGRSFHDYINGFRVREACGLLLEDPQRKIVDIAFAVGFNSLSTFHNAFQKSQGLSPRRYRESKRVESRVTPS